MRRSTKGILATHVGRLQRPDDLTEMLVKRQAGETIDEQVFGPRLKKAIADVVKQQAEAGLSVINDGEFGRISWLVYAFGRLSGFQLKPIRSEQNRTVLQGKDRRDFSDYYAYISAEGGRTYYRSPGASGAAGGVSGHAWECTGPIKYTGQLALRAEIEGLKAALSSAQVDEGFMTSTSPSDLLLAATNSYYPSEDAYLYALADALREEYRTITDSGLILQIDDPLLPAQWDLMLESNGTWEEYLEFAEQRIDVLNHALAGIPEDKVRYHICWGSHHGPHSTDIPMRKIIDLIFNVRAAGISFEAGNVRHEHEWQIWNDVRLPEGKILIPGVVSHSTNTIEHPELVALRIKQFAKLVGHENVIAGTDCGMGYRVHPQIAWAKLSALGEGARIATKELRL
jgi:5-methyltetrahydropteroyltriglutamate--homocysteine methyltransferase